MPLKNALLKKNAFLYRGYDNETSQWNKMKEDMWEEMQISNLFCALHSYSNSEEAPEWTLRNLTEIQYTGREDYVGVIVILCKCMLEEMQYNHAGL